jgi:hypothetical protein
MQKSTYLSYDDFHDDLYADVDTTSIPPLSRWLLCISKYIYRTTTITTVSIQM